MAPQPVVFCTFCGRVGRAVVRWRGSKYIARLLWTTLIIPGAIYNYWQWKGRKTVCAYCGSEYIRPADAERKASLSYDEMARLAAEEPFLARPEPPATKQDMPPAPKPRTSYSDPNQF